MTKKTQRISLPTAGSISAYKTGDVVVVTIGTTWNRHDVLADVVDVTKSGKTVVARVRNSGSDPIVFRGEKLPRHATHLEIAHYNWIRRWHKLKFVSALAFGDFGRLGDNMRIEVGIKFDASVVEGIDALIAELQTVKELIANEPKE